MPNATFAQHRPFEIDSRPFVLVIGIHNCLVDTVQLQDSFEQLDLLVSIGRTLVFNLQIISIDVQRLRDLKLPGSFQRIVRGSLLDLCHARWR